MADRSGSENGSARSLQRGNVNFDFLQPEEQRSAGEGPEDAGDKRGIFFRGRRHRPLSGARLAGWIALFAGSSLTLLWSAIYGASFAWLLLFPVLVLTMLWSVTMLALLYARPR